MKAFGGTVLFLDRSDINTDEIIPAKYLSANSREELKSFLLEDLKLPGFDPGNDLTGMTVIIARSNFGCGSSREHAVWALEENGINLVIAESFARIFRQNMYNCGMLAVELPGDLIERIIKTCSGKKVEIETDFDRAIILIRVDGEEERITFAVSDFDRALVKAGGWVEYADSKY